MKAAPPWPAAFLADWLQVDGGQWSKTFAGAADTWQQLLEAVGDEAQPAMGPWRSFWQFGKALSGYHEREPELSVMQALDRLLEALLQAIDVATSAELTLLAGFPSASTTGPAFGLWREWQKLGGRVLAAIQAERETGARLRLRQWHALRAGVAQLRAHLRAEDKSRPSIASLQALYDLLVDHLEAAYQDEMKTPAYAEVFGAHVNAALRLRDALGQLAAKTLGQFGLPTPADLGALEARLLALETASGVDRTQAKAPTRAAPASSQTASAQTLPTRKARSQKPRTKVAASPPQQAPAAPVKAAKRASPRRPVPADFDIGHIAPSRRDRR